MFDKQKTTPIQSESLRQLSERLDTPTGFNVPGFPQATADISENIAGKVHFISLPFQPKKIANIAAVPAIRPIIICPRHNIDFLSPQNPKTRVEEYPGLYLESTDKAVSAVLDTLTQEPTLDNMDRLRLQYPVYVVNLVAARLVNLPNQAKPIKDIIADVVEFDIKGRDLEDIDQDQLLTICNKIAQLPSQETINLVNRYLQLANDTSMRMLYYKILQASYIATSSEIDPKDAVDRIAVIITPTEVPFTLNPGDIPAPEKIDETRGYAAIITALIRMDRAANPSLNTRASAINFVVALGKALQNEPPVEQKTIQRSTPTPPQESRSKTLMHSDLQKVGTGNTIRQTVTKFVTIEIDQDDQDSLNTRAVNSLIALQAIVHKLPNVIQEAPLFAVLNKIVEGIELLDDKFIAALQNEEWDEVADLRQKLAKLLPERYVDKFFIFIKRWGIDLDAIEEFIQERQKEIAELQHKTTARPRLIEPVSDSLGDTKPRRVARAPQTMPEHDETIGEQIRSIVEENKRLNLIQDLVVFERFADFLIKWEADPYMQIHDDGHKILKFIQENPPRDILELKALLLKMLETINPDSLWNTWLARTGGQVAREFVHDLQFVMRDARAFHREGAL